MEIAKRIVEHAAPALPSSAYIGFFDQLNDPMKIAGLIVLLLQGIYTVVKIHYVIKTNHDDGESE